MMRTEKKTFLNGHTHIQAFGLFIKDLFGNDQSYIEAESNDFSMKDNVSFPSH